jgi:guanosine-3',5'-bis(diphosphate) 3'-pyrophosphohydrolase
VLRQYELLEKVRAYDPDADEAMINRAYVFSMKAHGSQKRASGDPYYSHPIEVAGILTDLHLDDETIVTAILHDTIEDTVATPEEIEKLFGPTSPASSTGSPSSARSRRRARASAPPRICASSCSPCPAT